MTKKYVLIPAFVMLACFSSCKHDVAWTHTESIPEDGWTSEHPVVFQLDPKAYEPEENRFVKMTSQAVGDTLPRLKGEFRAMLSLRYKDDCNASSLRIVIENASLPTGIHTDTISVTLFDKEGNPTGRGRFGLNEVVHPLPIPFTVTEGTTLTLSPLDYHTPVTGLLSTTLTLRELGMRN